MPKKKEYTLYTFNELSKKAKQRAIEDFRNDPELTWDDADSDMLTETFEQDLEDHFGLGRMKVGWGLGYCQGDGVCFWGPVNISKFIETEKMEKEFPKILHLANEGSVSVKITHESRNCHWNSMDVDAELLIGESDVIPKDLQRKLDAWEIGRQEIIGAWVRERNEVIARNMQPVRDWEEMVRRYHEVLKKGPREWTPRVKDPGPKPAPLSFPIPPEPVIEEPDWVKEARAMMASEYQAIERQLAEFREYLDGRIKEISQELEKNGYQEIEYHRSDEYITEVLENRDYEYLKDGERWDE